MSVALPELLLVHAQSRFCELGLASSEATEWRWEPITHGGSDRDFYRVRCDGGRSWVVMSYSDAREENALYAAIAEFLRDQGIRAPQLHFHDASSRLIGLEDLGDCSLYSMANGPGGMAHAESLYREALEQVLRLHKHASAPVPIMGGFDDKLYRWERLYFLENLVERWAGIRLTEAERATLDREGEEMAGRLLAAPRCLIHRDFQSQNLIVRDGGVWMIDFQGMRLGHAAYDVASLLYDPYVDVGAERREALLAVYAARGVGKSDDFRGTFYRAAAQRLMQALGAYGFLGLVKGKKDFLRHIPRGLAHLSDALDRMGEMPGTRELVKRIGIESARRL